MNQRSHQRVIACAALCAAVFWFAVGPANARGEDAEDLKAAFIYRLCQFVTWPPVPEDVPFVIGVVGETPVDERLKEIVADKVFGGRKIEVRRFVRLSELEDADVVFVAYHYRRWTERIIGFYQDKPVLLIGEYEDFAARGGTVAIHFPGDRLKLKINYRAALDAGLGLSAKLLAVAEDVIGAP